jgi:hypothetical protein
MITVPTIPLITFGATTNANAGTYSFTVTGTLRSNGQSDLAFVVIVVTTPPVQQPQVQ